MCELLAVKSGSALPIEQVLMYAEQMEEYGVAGFGWGVAWTAEDGTINRYRSALGIRKDTLYRRALKGVMSSNYLIHLRRPSLMTTIALQNSQPYMTADASYAFAHNGLFKNHKKFRDAFVSQMEGTIDSEVGFYYWRSLLDELAPEAALSQTHAKMGGNANIGVVQHDGTLYFYAGNPENKAYEFELDGLSMAATSLHSNDNFLFQTIFPRARSIEEIPLHSVKILQPPSSQQ